MNLAILSIYSLIKVSSMKNSSVLITTVQMWKRIEIERDEEEKEEEVKDETNKNRDVRKKEKIKRRS